MNYINIELGLSYVGGIERIYYRLLKNLVENYQNFIEEISTLYASNINEYHRKVHSLKGIAMNLGSETLYLLCQQIESDLHNEKLLLKIQELFPKILKSAEEITRNYVF
ncbi:MAG: Hpt domain-containing protein [Erysipelotrichales bacterium]|nr:Hpt domain-containing protein [Erysipelotrichales bacterium]